MLQLPPEAQSALAERQISEGHARAILALKGQAKAQAALLKHRLHQGWNVRQAERYVTSLKAGVAEPAAIKARVETETPATKALAKHLGAAVHLKRTAKGGRLEISFTSDDQLHKILAQLQ